MAGDGLDPAGPPSDAGEKEGGSAWPYTTADLLGGDFEEDEGTAFPGCAGLAGGGEGKVLGALPFRGAPVVSSFICSLSAIAYAWSSLSFKQQGQGSYSARLDKGEERASDSWILKAAGIPDCSSQFANAERSLSLVAPAAGCRRCHRSAAAVK